MSPELNCLLAAIAFSTEGRQTARQVPNLGDTAFLRRVVALSLQTRTFSLLYDWLSRHSEIDTEFVHNSYKRYKAELIARNTQILKVTKVASEALLDANIQHVIIKGPLQQKQVYGDYFVRPCSDIDLLVRYRNYNRSIRAVCAKLDLRVINKSPFFWWDLFVGERHLVSSEAKDWSIDLHHRVQAPGSPQPRATGEMVDSAVLHGLMGGSIPILAPSYLPILSALSIAKAFRRHEVCAAHIVDLYKMTNRLSETELAVILELAEQQGLAGTMNLALATTAACFGGPVRATKAFSLPCNPELLPVMAFTPSQVGHWPSTAELLACTAQGPNASYGRERAWFGLSEVSRKLEKVVTLAKRSTGNLGRR